eukprot:TRINITY_DN54128_c0_g1_i1.p1 TRINITY_DN54128_c0_g1~~TRINITY_DN54128_c0_g1_i1.p1  ORF type:complete len:260 (-),score=100.95 TRINITY_DN54128_c0_g1_i1:41-820(-)
MLLRARKKVLRRVVGRVLRALSAGQVAAQSEAIARRLVELRAFREAKGVCVYLSMPKGEVDTTAVVKAIFDAGKRCFVPRIASKTEIQMVEVHSLEQIESLPRDSWGIPIPPAPTSTSSATDDSKQQAIEATECTDMSFIVMPGVAFDRTMNRLGHGAGYYDRYLRRMHGIRTGGDHAIPMPQLVAVAFREQIVSSDAFASALKKYRQERGTDDKKSKISAEDEDAVLDAIVKDGEVPHGDTDWLLDGIVTPDGFYGSS